MERISRFACFSAGLGGANGFSLVQRRASVGGAPPLDPIFCPGEMVGHMGDATVFENNLGGMGPQLLDPPVISYLNVGTCDGKQVDLVVSNSSRYEPDGGAAFRNGRDGTGNFGMINMECGTNSLLHFNFFVDSAPVIIEQLYWGFHDIDSGNKEIVKEWMGVYSTFDEAFLVNDTELIEEAMVPLGTMWKSSEPGNGPDNPTDAMSLTEQQKKRTVTLSMTNATVIDVDFGVTSKAGCKGRNLMFSFKSSLVPSTPAPTPSPSMIAETCSTCVIWGDPHVITFQAHERRLEAHPNREEFFRTRQWKSDQVTVNEAGLYWLVHSSDVRIQGSYVKNDDTNTTNLKELAVSGPFLDNKVLIILPSEGKTTFYGSEILSSVPSEFKNSLVDAKYHKDGRMVKDGTHGPSMDFALPSGVFLTVNRWKDSLAVEIQMCDRGVDKLGGGQCNAVTSTVM